MAIKKVTRKIISRLPKSDKDQPQPQVNQSVSEVDEKEVTLEASSKGPKSKKCLFCQSESNPSYTNLDSLRRFLTDRAKIVARERSGVCSKHQRAVARNIKYARHLSLLPFVPKV